MVLRLDPAVPLIWRTPDSLQLGVERHPIVVEHVDRADEVVIDALRRGAPRSALEVVATLGGRTDAAIAAAAVDRLLARLGSAVVETADPRPPQQGALVLGVPPLAGRVAGLLAAAGAAPDAGPLGVVVLVAAWVLAPGAAVEWMSRDIPHLPVVVADGRVAIGPLVRPGETPCLYCLHRARADADPAWPAVGAQLLARPAPALEPLAMAEAAALATRAALAGLDGGGPRGQLVLDTLSGAVSERPVAPHPACACGAHPGSGWARAAAPTPPAACRTAPPSSAPAAAGRG